jgi:hypothetical protein
MSEVENPYASPVALSPFADDEGAHAEDYFAKRRAATGLGLVGGYLLVKLLTNILFYELSDNRVALLDVLGLHGLMLLQGCAGLIALGAFLVGLIGMFYCLPMAGKVASKVALIGSIVCQFAGPLAIIAFRMSTRTAIPPLGKNLGLSRENIIETMIVGIGAVLFFVFLRSLARHISIIDYRVRINVVTIGSPLLFSPSTGFKVLTWIGIDRSLSVCAVVYAVDGALLILLVNIVLRMRKALLLEPAISQT